MEELELDERICSTALICIFIVVILSSLIRQNIVAILKSENKVDLKDIKSNNIIGRSKLLKAHGYVLTEKAYKTRKDFFNKKDVGVFYNPPPSVNPLEAMSKQDPSQAMGMLKSQMSFVLLNGGLAYLINYLFSGFLVAKAPFPLTYRFKSMLQRGVDVPYLDVTYVSSLSWYFFIMFGSNGLISIINFLKEGENTASGLTDINSMDMNNPMMMAHMATNPMSMMLPGVSTADHKKQFNEEREALEIINHQFSLMDVETRLLQGWKRKKTLTNLQD